MPIPSKTPTGTATPSTYLIPASTATPTPLTYLVQGSTPTATLAPTPTATPRPTLPIMPDDIVADKADNAISLYQAIDTAAKGINNWVPSPPIAFFTGLYSQGFRDRDLDMNPGEKLARSLLVGAEYVGVDFLSTGVGTSAGVTLFVSGIGTGPGALIVGGGGFVVGNLSASMTLTNMVDAANEKRFFPGIHNYFLP